VTSEHVDVLIVGAGLSGIGAACHLERRCPQKRYAILEARGASGGTWDLFRYPGIRSDSDMYTLGYAFRPWDGTASIADGPSILRYIRDTAREHGVDRHIRYHHRVVRADWSGAEARWTVQAERADTGETVRLTCDFLLACTGYYRYDEGYTPELPGVERFTGELVHPQHWPEDLDHAGRRVVVIGSGATAITLVPAMAERAAHVTMLQRSPTYIVSLPAEDPVARLARRVLPRRAAYTVVRWKNVAVSTAFYQLCRRAPRLAKRIIREGVVRRLPAGYDVDTHFAPRYDPWDQRLCLVPDGDLFRAISGGRASIVTDHIETFTETGIRLASGAELEADIVVTATGLNLLALGGMELAVDGRPVRLPETYAYKGMMLGGVPNMAFVVGYTNASWTLKADLTCAYVCRLLQHMDAHGHRQVVPVVPDPPPRPEPFIDLQSGYVLRALDRFPRQGDRTPWRLHQNYLRDIALLRHRPVDDGTLAFSGPQPAAREPEPLAA
jgi:cation diffusion facilitator CzcD-associated flavoprotein CzcO